MRRSKTKFERAVCRGMISCPERSRRGVTPQKPLSQSGYSRRGASDAQTLERDTPNLLRLKTTSLLCFQSLTEVFNRTLLRLEFRGIGSAGSFHRAIHHRRELNLAGHPNPKMPFCTQPQSFPRAKRRRIAKMKGARS